MRKILLSQGKYALIDNLDFEDVSKYTWHWTPDKNGTGYAARTEYLGLVNGKPRWRKARMHRQIMEFPFGKEVDHKDGDGLNNRRSNLRLANNSENSRNRGAQSNSKTGIKGVSWKAKSKKWQAQIKLNGKVYYLGVFTNIEDAAQSYAKAAKEMHGEFARVR